MSEAHPVFQYLKVAFIVLCLSLGVTLGLFYFVADVLGNPASYRLEYIPKEQLELYLLALAGLLASISVFAVFYMALGSKARQELAIWDATRWLAVSREQFRRVYEAAPVPYLTLDERGLIRDPNKAALRFFGTTTEGLEGKELFSFLRTEDAVRGKELKEYYRRNVPIDRQEIQLQTGNGTLKWVSLSIFDMHNPASLNSRTGLATIFDITEQKQLDQAKTEFVSLASHQLRTPIATTKWFTDMLLSGDLGALEPKQRDYVQKIYTTNQGMIELVDTLLNVSRIEIGTLPIEMKPTNVPEICESILAEMAPQISKKKLQIERKFEGSLVSIKSDAKLLRIVVHNLISNAIKYTPEGGTVTVQLEKDGLAKKITVKDTGYGIPKAQQERVFSKLFRADNVVTLPEQGTGLGLYLVKSITERLGGSISFTSEENKGSTFIISIT